MGDQGDGRDVEEVRKSKGGRPRKGEGEKLKQVTVWLGPELLKEVTAAAEREGRSRSKYMREAIEARLGRRAVSTAEEGGVAAQRLRVEITWPRYERALDVLSNALRDLERMRRLGVDTGELTSRIKDYVAILDDVIVVEDRS